MICGSGLRTRTADPRKGAKSFRIAMVNLMMISGIGLTWYKMRIALLIEGSISSSSSTPVLRFCTRMCSAFSPVFNPFPKLVKHQKALGHWLPLLPSRQAHQMQSSTFNNSHFRGVRGKGKRTDEKGNFMGSGAGVCPRT